MGGAAYAVLAHVLFLASQPAPSWLLLVFAAAATGFANRSTPTSHVPLESETPPRWLFHSALLFLALTTGAIAVGSIATEPRAWDGIVAWGIKTAALTQEPSLQKAFFSDPIVYHHSPDYPLLQPLILAHVGSWVGPDVARLFFALLYVILIAVSGLTVARLTGNRKHGLIAAFAVGVTPCFINSGGGSADSGYGELFLAVSLTVACSAILLQDSSLLIAAAATLPLIKPEGTIYGAILVASTFIFAHRKLLSAALLGWACSLAIWLPTQISLAYGPRNFAPLFAVTGLAVCIYLARFALDRLGMGTRQRVILTATGALAAILITLLNESLLAAHDSPLIGHYMGGISRISDKISSLPEILLGLTKMALEPQRFGLTYVLLIGALALSYMNARTQAKALHIQSIVLSLALGLVVIGASFLLSPEADIQHHLRSSGGRLLSHWIGPCWLIIAIVTSRRLGEAHSSQHGQES
jgi:hypothetical protein